MENGSPAAVVAPTAGNSEKRYLLWDVKSQPFDPKNVRVHQSVSLALAAAGKPLAEFPKENLVRVAAIAIHELSRGLVSTRPESPPGKMYLAAPPWVDVQYICDRLLPAEIGLSVQVSEVFEGTK